MFFSTISITGKVFSRDEPFPGGRRLYTGWGGVMGLRLAALWLVWGWGYSFRANTWLSEPSLLLPLIRPRACRNTHSLYEKKTIRSVKQSLQDHILKGKGKHRI